MKSTISFGAVSLTLALIVVLPPASAGTTGLYVEAGAGMLAANTDDGLVKFVQDFLNGASSPDVDESSFKRSADKSDIGFALAAGYRIAPNLAVEVAYMDLGKYRRSLVANSASGPVEFNVSTSGSGLAASVVGLWALSDRLTLDARTGMYSFRIKKTNSSFQGTKGAATVTIEKDSSGKSLPDGDRGLLLGLGATWSFTSSLDLRLGYTYFDNVNSEFGVQRLGLGLKYSF